MVMLSSQQMAVLPILGLIIVWHIAKHNAFLSAALLVVSLQVQVQGNMFWWPQCIIIMH